MLKIKDNLHAYHFYSAFVSSFANMIVHRAWHTVAYLILYFYFTICVYADHLQMKQVSYSCIFSTFCLVRHLNNPQAASIVIWRVNFLNQQVYLRRKRMHKQFNWTMYTTCYTCLLCYHFTSSDGHIVWHLCNNISCRIKWIVIRET